MVVEFEPSATSSDIKSVIEFVIHRLRYLREIDVCERHYLIISGYRDDINVKDLSSKHGVRRVTSPDTTAFFCRREFYPSGKSQVAIGDLTLGNGHLMIIAGPCAVECEDDLYATAKAVKAAGAHMFRAGAFKPRTSPYNFQGLGVTGLRWLSEVRQTVGLPVVSEVLDPYDVEIACEHLDMLQVGTRNMTNQSLLKHLGKANRPILLKRGASSKLEELVRAAEFITVEGNPNIVLCERGIQTFETATRNTLDLSAVPALRCMTHLPIVVDPSHATGRSDLVTDMALAAAIVGTDGLMVEVHVAPERMIKPGDGQQALLPEQFLELVQKLKKVLKAVDR